ncbi:hypothetical protein Tco_0384489, partial [Tanacetum coccineum]
DDDDDVEEDEEEEEEHLAPADSTVVGSLTIDHVPSIPIPFPFEEEVARLLALPTPPPSPLTPLLSPPTSPTYDQAPLGSRAAMMRATPSHIPLPPSFIPSPI